jgi:hypothetical protein
MKTDTPILSVHEYSYNTNVLAGEQAVAASALYL